MHKWILFSAFALLLAVGASAVNSAATKVASANSKFGLSLYSQLHQKSESKNIFFSPSSVSWCLSMVFNGAGGNTKQEMAQALQIGRLSLQELNSGYGEWRNTFVKPDPKVEIDIANSIWSRRGLAFRPEFLQTNKNFYAAEVSELDFNDPKSLSTINSWVKNKTRGKIEKIIDQISTDSVLFLINAIYFKAKWAIEFDPAKTKEENFLTSGGKQEHVKMMRQRGDYQYQEHPEFQSVTLPYGDGRLSMLVFLPAKSSNLNKFHQMLTQENWEKWMTQYEKSEGTIGLPRFRIEYESSLNDALKALGMRKAFDPAQADFGAMITGSQKAYLSQVKHKAFVEVNEEGTEAAAVTSGEIRVVSMPLPGKTFQMIVDRPFFFAIRDSSTGAILFMGSVSDPV
jgi:serine protease inhibitor